MKKIILLGVVTFLIALLSKTPASIIAPWLTAGSPFTLQAVSGSLWKGRAGDISYEKISLGSGHWTVSPFGLLAGAFQGQFGINGNDMKADGGYQYSFTNRLMLDQTQFKIDGGLINQLQRYARLNGQFVGKINHLEMSLKEPLQPPLVSGLLNWERGSLTSPVKLPAGNYQLKIEPETEGVLIARVSAKDAPVDIKGSVTLDSEWQYRTDLKLKTTASGQGLNGMLSMVGRPQSDGYISIVETGKLLKEKE